MARQAVREGVSAERRIRNLTDAELTEFIQRHQWTPEYLPYRCAPDARPARGL
ncbi:hypothetical protein [Deinococcus radiophilus]|uniref:hypothetical protein n=1 Tax=Deinococcus radiophilus TaxID=32062 RepID=UPI003606CC06